MNIKSQINDEEFVPKVLEFLKKKPHFFDECNPLFYDAFQKTREKLEFAESFKPALNLLIISAKIRSVIHKVIDDFYRIKKGKRAQFKYFENAKFMLPALMTKSKAISKINYVAESLEFNNSSEKINESSDDDSESSYLLKKRPRNERTKEIHCKICDFSSPSNLYMAHFGLLYHKKGEIKWKKRNMVKELQCPCCENSYQSWCNLLNHIEDDHNLQKDEINFKVFTIKNYVLNIELSSDLTLKNNRTAQIFYEKENMSDAEFIKRIKKQKSC